MNENKKTYKKVEGVEKFSFMTFYSRKKDGTTFYALGTTADMVETLPEKVAKRIEESGQKWLDVWFVKKNREECHKAIKIEDKAKYTIENPARVWITKNAKGYLAFTVDCVPESIHKFEKEAKQNDNEAALDDLPF